MLAAPRLLPIAIAATGALLFLKTVGLMTGSMPGTGARPAMAQEALPDDIGPLITGSTAARAQPVENPTVERAGQGPAPAATASVSPSERAILERLQERRQELDARSREIEMRENLLRAAERRLEQRAAELRELEGRITALETRRDEAETNRFRGVVSMYETMRARDAARIFDTLDLAVLIEVARAMRPAKLADVMAQMQAEPARRLTMELAKRPGQAAASVDPRQAPLNELPKIEGRPVR